MRAGQGPGCLLQHSRSVPAGAGLTEQTRRTFLREQATGLAAATNASQEHARRSGTHRRGTLRGEGSTRTCPRPQHERGRPPERDLLTKKEKGLYEDKGLRPELYGVGERRELTADTAEREPLRSVPDPPPIGPCITLHSETGVPLSNQVAEGSLTEHRRWVKGTNRRGRERERQRGTG